MAQYRQDPCSGRWVIIAPKRVDRPVSSPHRPLRAATDSCVFCEGQEESTTPETAAVREPGTSPGGPGWRVRAISNKYPAVDDGATAVAHGEGLFQSLGGAGVHEVIVECPQHEVSLARLSVDNIREVLHVYRQRIRALRDDATLAYALVFKNVGELAGASLEHSHSQLLATPIIPAAIQQELETAAEYFRRHEKCLFCDVIEEELAGPRAIRQTGAFALFCPYASRFPFETWLLPRRHAARFEEAGDEILTDLATELKGALSRLETVLNSPSYNLVLHTSPLGAEPFAHYHWHLEILPRLAQLAGFEHGSGFFINPIPPEHAAEILRAGVAWSGTGGTQFEFGS